PQYFRSPSTQILVHSQAAVAAANNLSLKTPPGDTFVVSAPVASHAKSILTVTISPSILMRSRLSVTTVEKNFRERTTCSSTSEPMLTASMQLAKKPIQVSITRRIREGSKKNRFRVQIRRNPLRRSLSGLVDRPRKINQLKSYIQRNPHMCLIASLCQLL